ncbi:MAG: LacI family DNA-binding transcriptional regulator [Aristaeellaceae bacterium]
MKRSVSMQDVADRLGVSKNSVYLALNGKNGISAALKEQILATAAEMGYGRTLARSNASCVVTVLPEYLRNDSFFYADVFWSIEDEVKRCGYLSMNAVVSTDMEAGLEMPALPQNMEIAGVVVVGIFADEYIQALYSLGYPMLSVDICYARTPISCVETANFTGGYDAANHLIAQGHRSIGFAGPIYSARSVYERWCGFRQAMEEHQLTVERRWRVTGRPGSRVLFDTVEDLSGAMQDVDDMPTAWFCAGDRIAVAMMNVLQMRGLSVPQDVSVMGFDDLPIAEMVMPRLTTMHVQRKRMGSMAVRLMLHDEMSTEGPCIVQLPAALVERDSVAAPKDV